MRSPESIFLDDFDMSSIFRKQAYVEDNGGPSRTTYICTESISRKSLGASAQDDAAGTL